MRSLLLGATAGARSMTPLAALAVAAHEGELPEDNGAPRLLGRPIVVFGVAALAVGELAGDKMKSAPDRIVAPGLAARLVTGAVAGAAMAPRKDRYVAAGFGAAAAVASSYLTFHLRMRALRRFGQTPSGLVEDALTVSAATWIVAGSPAQA